MRQWARIRVDRLCDLYRHHIPDPDGIVLRKQQLLSLCDEHYCRVTPRKGLRGEEEEKRRYRPYLKSCTTVTHGLPACEEVVVVRPRKRSLTRLASRVVRSSLRQVEHCPHKKGCARALGDWHCSCSRDTTPARSRRSGRGNADEATLACC
jgi:hypothetical protein